METAVRTPRASQSARARWYRILEGHERSPLARLVNGLIVGVIFLNILVVVLETVPVLERAYGVAFFWVEVVSVGLFTLEYLARLWVAVENPRFAGPIIGRLRYAMTPMAIVDLVAILPSFIGSFAEFDARLLRLLRLLRMLKLTRYSHSLDMLITVFRREYSSMISATFIMVVVILFAAGGIYYLEHDIQPEHFGSIPQAVWWATVTLTTVGYGDVVPVTPFGKAFGLLITICGVGMAALPAGILASGFTAEIERRRELYELKVREALEDGHLSAREQHRLHSLGRQLGLDEAQVALAIEKEADEVLHCPQCGSAVSLRQMRRDRQDRSRRGR